MESVRLKTALFGFRRKQVLQYIDDTCAAYTQKLNDAEARREAELTALRSELEEKLHIQQNALSVQMEENQRLDQELIRLSESLDEKYTLLQEEQQKNQELSELAETEKAKVLLLEDRLATATKEHEALAEEHQQLQRQLAAKDHLIADQTVELTRLQERVSHLGETFDSMQVQADQSQAMVDCLNMLHERNRMLSSKVAQLEAQLQDAQSGRQVKELEQVTTQKQELLKSTETLFTAVRKEIQEALQAIALKIEDTAVSEESDENLFVDMAEL